MSDRAQANYMEVIRQRLTAIRKTYQHVKSDVMLDTAAKAFTRHGKQETPSFNLRGGDNEDTPETDTVKTPRRHRGSPGLHTTKPITENLDALSKQLSWLRRMQSEIDQMFTGRHAVILRNDVTKMAEDIDQLIHQAISDKKFPKGRHPPSPEFTKAVEIAHKYVKRLVKNITTTELITSNHAGEKFYTTMLMGKDVKTETGVIPSYVIAISESEDDNPNNRRRFVTQLPGVNMTFDPKYKYTDLDDLTRVLKLVTSKHFIDIVPSEGTKNVNPDSISKVKGVKHTTITKTGALRVVLQPKADVDTIQTEIYKLLVNEIRKTNPLFKGNITYVEGDKDGEHYITFSAPMGNESRLSKSNLLHKVLNISPSNSKPVNVPVKRR
jgi:hypothetical protein